MKKILVLVVLAILCSGCATAKKTGYLKNYTKMHKGEYLENFWADTTLISENQYSKILIESVTTKRITDKKGITAQECGAWLQSAMSERVYAYKKHFILDSDSGQEDAKLEIAITEMSPGSAGKRMFAGELGMGHAWIQVEGRVVDVNSGKEIITFSDRRRSSGIAGFKDLAGDSGPDLIHGMLNQAGSDIMIELIEVFGF